MLIRSLIYFFLYTVSSIVATKPTILTGKNDAICRRVQAKANNNNSYVRLFVNETVADYKISGLIFNYKDILNFTSVPAIENFTDLYPTNKTKLYSTILGGDGRFIVDAAEDHSVDTLRFWSGIIDKEIIFPVSESGTYCVYIAPDPVKALDFELPVHFKNYYGNLRYSSYLYYTSLKWIFIILFATIAAIFKFLKDLGAGGSQSLSSVKTAINTLVMLTFVPFVLMKLFDFCHLFVQNSVFAPYQGSSIESFLSFLSLLISMFDALFQFYVALLFSMGLGAIYYYKSDPNYREFLPEWSQMATKFPLASAYIVWLTPVLLGRPITISLFGTSKTILPETSYKILNYTSQLFNCIMFILSVKFYFKTKKKLTISSFSTDIGSIDKVVSPFNLDTESIDKVVLTFKKTTMTFWFIPIVIFGLTLMIMCGWVFYYILNDVFDLKALYAY